MDDAATLDTQCWRMIFDLRAVAYRADPTDEHFRDLLKSCPAGAGPGLLTDVLYEAAARNKPPRAPLLVHLLQVLVEGNRWLEALHFCREWVQEEPDCIEAHDVAAEAACRCFDIHEAQAMVEALEQLGAGEVHVSHVELAYRLTFCNAQGASEVVQRLLSTGSMDRRTAILAVDAALRLEAPLLLAEVLLAHPDAIAPGEVGLAKRILRVRVVEILGDRATAGQP